MASGGRQGSSSKKTAEDYSNESLAASMDASIVYSKNEGNLESWLERYPPSVISRADGIGWIEMVREGGAVVGSDVNHENLHKEFQELKVSTTPVSFFSIRELAKNNGLLTGGWLFHVDTGPKVDVLWRMVATAFDKGGLSKFATSVRVSPVNPEDAKEEHVIVAKHGDFTDEEEVESLHDALRAAGIKTKLGYKPEVYSCLGIYRNNQFNLQPTIYTSTYDLLKRVSTLTCHYKMVDGLAAVRIK